MNDLQKECEALKEKLVELEARIKEEQNNDDEWPKLGDKYWCESPCDDSGVFQALWTNHYSDFHSKTTGNCFRTQEEAEFHLERLKVMAELERLSDNDGKCFTDMWAIHTNGKVVYPICYIKSTGTPYIFKTESKVLKAIETIGEERLKKYWIGVKEAKNE